MKTGKIYRLICAFLAAAVMIPLASCSKKDGSDKAPAAFGPYGASVARELADKYPFRKAYSDGERGAGEFIKTRFEELGYDVKVQEFSGSAGRLSHNYIVSIEGKGFFDENGDEVRRKVVIGAHYDDALSELDTAGGYNGISDNASGIGCILTIASKIRTYEDMGFDIDIVAFGAGLSDYAGAYCYFNSLSGEERDQIEVMYCIDSIYAGDKMYASAGLNSLNPNKKYEMRRKLYQAYDVAYDRELASKNGYSLLYNESNIIADINGDGSPDIFREVSNRPSDYVVFDKAGIPVVYFDSCDYFFDTLEEMKETKNLQLQQFGGNIRGTSLDASSVLDPIFVSDDEDRLEIRINNTAYVILESLMKGSDHAMTEAQYEQYLKDLKEGKITESTVPSESMGEGAA